jgi:hypothetical protein
MPDSKGYVLDVSGRTSAEKTAPKKREQGSRILDRVYSKINCNKMITKIKENLSGGSVSNYATYQELAP